MGFLEELQSADRATKKKVLVASSAAAIILVVFVWIGYFNTIVAQGPTPADSQSQAASAAPASDSPAAPSPSLAQSLRSMGAAVSAALRGGASWVGGLFAKPREYIITPSGNATSAENLQ